MAKRKVTPKAPAKKFYVCSNGHIFRSVEVIKSGRVRQCGSCMSICTTPGHDSIADARAIVAKRHGSAKANEQVFRRGQMVRVIHETPLFA
jgi:hypothetical protein